MRVFIFLISLFLISGCISIKKYESVNDTILNDESIGYSKEFYTYSQPSGETMMMVKRRKANRETSQIKKSESKYNIINLIDTTKLVDNGFAIMGYNVPNFFIVNKKATIKLRISKENNIESVVIGNRNIPIIGLNSSDNIILETIKVGDEMSAKLYTDKEYFLVELVNSGSTQNIEEEGYTEWVWRLTPLKSGNSYIKMIITMSGKDIVVYEKEIPVESNWSWSFSNWFTKWWQAVTATIITPILIPLFIWLYNRKRKKSKE
jgi:hypothetical protein